MKIIPINQTTFVLLQIVLNVIASLIMNANFDTMDATSTIFMLLISISIFAAVNYTVYARVLDANKSRNIAHFILIVNILSVFSNTLSMCFIFDIHCILLYFLLFRRIFSDCY